MSRGYSHEQLNSEEFLYLLIIFLAIVSYLLYMLFLFIMEHLYTVISFGIVILILYILILYSKLQKAIENYKTHSFCNKHKWCKLVMMFYKPLQLYYKRDTIIMQIENMKEQAITDAKLEVLYRLPMYDLRFVAMREQLRPGDGRLKSSVVWCLTRNLSLDKIIQYARYFRIYYEDIINKLDKALAYYNNQIEQVKKYYKLKIQKQQAQTNQNNQFIIHPCIYQFYRLINIINNFKPIQVYDEKDLEYQLYYYLRTFYNDQVQNQLDIGNGIIDLAVKVYNCWYGIELKLARSNNDLDRLLGQIKRYKEKIHFVIPVVYYDGEAIHLDMYKQLFQKEGFPLIVLTSD